MITTTQIRKADAAVAYFGRELTASDYYLAEKGVWYGKGARILGLESEVSKEDFVSIVNNQAPGSGQTAHCQEQHDPDPDRLETGRGDPNQSPDPRKNL